MSFEREHVTRSGIDLNSAISEGLARDIVDQLAPPLVRGTELRGSGMTNITGSVGTTIYSYENVGVVFYFSVMSDDAGIEAVVLSWKNRRCKNEGNAPPLGEYPR
jgi:hypothetical protein